jgi:hypothetical protein
MELPLLLWVVCCGLSTVGCLLLPAPLLRCFAARAAQAGWPLSSSAQPVARLVIITHDQLPLRPVDEWLHGKVVSVSVSVSHARARRQTNWRVAVVALGITRVRGRIPEPDAKYPRLGGTWNDQGLA